MFGCHEKKNVIILSLTSLTNAKSKRKANVTKVNSLALIAIKVAIVFTVTWRRSTEVNKSKMLLYSNEAMKKCLQSEALKIDTRFCTPSLAEWHFY